MTEVSRLAERDGEAGEGSKAFEVTTPVRLDQLNAEVTKAMNWRNPADLSAEGSLTETDESHPLIVWVGRGDDLDTNKFLAAVRAHEPDPAWSDPNLEPGTSIEEVKAKAASGAFLGTEDLQVAVRHLLNAETEADQSAEE